MTFTQITILLGGLALFLFGMKMMSDGLEQSAGDRMKRILEKLTSNRFKGVAVGAGITAVIQSSSATTVMVVGFVNSGIMTLRQAIWVIMGANIGTTITGQLIALDIGVIAPLFAIAGVVLIVFFKSKKLNHIGYIIAGLGVLFIGMNMMSDSMSSLRDSQTFVDIVGNLSNPLLGILAGMIFTAIIQSSSASVGILQALAIGGVISLPNAVFVLFGQNIGTCITAVLASIGTSRNARRATLIHIMFNVIGTCIFVAICLLTPFVPFVESLVPNNPAAQIANVHTIFNIVTTILLLPFGILLEKVAKKILPEHDSEIKEEMCLRYITPQTATNHSFAAISISVSQIHNETSHMFELAERNVNDSFNAILDWKDENIEIIQKNEEYVDFLNKEISLYISSLMSNEMTETEAKTVSSYFKIIGNIERISDHAVNISEYAEMLHKKGYCVSEEAYAEVEEMRETTLNMIKLIDLQNKNMSQMNLASISQAEKRIDDLTELYRSNQIDRLRANICAGDISVIYSEMITDFERIGDHVLNIAELLNSCYSK